MQSSNAFESRGRLLYTARVIQDGARAFREESAELDATLALALALAREGACHPHELAAKLCREMTHITEDEALFYIGELIRAQILEPELLPAVTGQEPVERLATALNATTTGRAIAEALIATQQAFARFETSSLGLHPEEYRALGRSLATIPGAEPLDRMFQIDLTKPARQATLHEGLVADILVGVEALRRLGDSTDPLAEFKQRFIERHGPGEAPFLEALDEETGFWRTNASMYVAHADSPLLDRIRFPEALPLPDAFSVGATVIGSPQSVAQGLGQVYVRWFRGPSGATLLGRFCHADPELHAQVSRHLRAEESLNPGAIIAEVAHQPEGRLGNVVLRPVLRDFEIPYLGKSGAPPESQIPPSDLFVSVANDRVFLRSRRLDCRVIPSFTNMMTTAKSRSAYAFLNHVAAQGVCPGGAFSWYPFDRMTYLPRVVMGRLVLSPAQWTVAGGDLKRLRQKAGRVLFEAAAVLRDRLDLPRYVILPDGDSQLLVDFDNVLSVEAFAHRVQHRQWIRLTEVLASWNELCVSGPEGRFTHEIVLPFVKHRGSSRPPTRWPSVSSTPPKFLPGGDWFYAKLYAPVALLDEVICSVIPPLLDALRREHVLTTWFFVRYADPDWHLRLRLRGSTRSIGQSALSRLEALVQPLAEKNVIHRLDLGTFEPELSRYGGEAGMALAEEVFALDSDAVLEILGWAGGEELEPAWRWQLALYGTDRWLRDFDLSLEERHALVTDIVNAHENRPATRQSTLARQLGDTFRAVRSVTAQILDEVHPPEDLAPGLAPLRARSQQSLRVAAEVRLLSQCGQLGVPLGDWLRSIVHMSANRLLASSARQHELVIADVLRRFYKSRIARRDQKAD